MEHLISDKMMQFIVQKGFMGLVLFDANKKVVFCNDTILNLTACTLQDFIGTDFFEKIVKEEKYRTAALAKVEACFQKPFDDFDLQIFKKTGGTIFLHLAGSAFDYEGRAYALLVLQDIK